MFREEPQRTAIAAGCENAGPYKVRAMLTGLAQARFLKPLRIIFAKGGQAIASENERRKHYEQNHQPYL